jgi:hypothetical protein
MAFVQPSPPSKPTWTYWNPFHSRIDFANATALRVHQTMTSLYVAREVAGVTSVPVVTGFTRRALHRLEELEVDDCH